MTATAATNGRGAVHRSAARVGPSALIRVRSRAVDACARQSPGGEPIRTPKGMELTDPGDWIVTIGEETWVMTDASFRKTWSQVASPGGAPS